MPTTIARTFFFVGLGLTISTAPAVAAPIQRHPVHNADALQAKLAVRIDAVDAKLTAARRADRISVADAVRMEKTLERVRKDSAKYARQQGFLSASESASYNRTLDAIEARLS